MNITSAQHPPIPFSSIPSLPAARLLTDTQTSVLSLLEHMPVLERQHFVVHSLNPCPEYLDDLWQLGPCVLLSGPQPQATLDWALERAENGMRYRETHRFTSSLIPSERILLRHLPSGLSNKHIAKRLKLSDRTVRNRLALLKAACRWGWRKHALCESDPTVRMQLPEVRNERHVYASRRQMLQLARAADRPDVRAMIRTAFYSGMRLGEMMRVEVADGVLHLADTKNGERRSIPAHPRISTCLRYLPLAAQKRTLQAAWARARRACGMTHLHLHDLRHSAASEMINAEVDLFTVGAVLGHKDPRSTQRYAHLTHGTLAAAVNKIGRKTGQTPPHNDQEKSRPKAA